MSSFADSFLVSTTKLFSYYKTLGERTMDQVSDQELFDIPHADGNSISIIVKHLHGNMLSRWTDFLESDGEKEWRERDGEFEDSFRNREDLMKSWEEGWEVLFKALKTVNADNFDQTVYIRNQGHTISDAINRQLAHYAYHIGQLVLLGKMFRGADWKSLSIPKGDSDAFNQEKFSSDKNDQHFTDEFLQEE